MFAITNGRILQNGQFITGYDLLIQDGYIAGIVPQGQFTGPATDVFGAYVTPGLIDMHIHGIAGHDTMQGTAAVKKMALALIRHGVTAFLPSTVPDTITNMRAAVSTLPACANGAEALGFHLEGPFVNPQQKGALAQEYLLPPTIDVLEQIGTQNLRTVTMAPELEDAAAVAQSLQQKGIVVCAGHTATDADAMRKATQFGFTHATHLYNGMPPMHHRTPGPVAAVLTTPNYSAEIIADGIHVDWEMIGLAMQCKPNLALVSDSIAATGLADGEYVFAGQPITVTNGAARTAQGNLAGSTLTLNRAVKNLIEHNLCTPARAFAMATSIPADILHLPKYGKLQSGCFAHFVVWNDDITARSVYLAGRQVHYAH